MGEIHFKCTLYVPDAIQSIGKTCIDKVAQLKNACTSIKNEIRENGKIKTLRNTISGRAHQVKQKIHDKIDSVKNFFDGSPDLKNIEKNLPDLNRKELFSSKHFLDAVIQVHNDKKSFETKGEYAQALYEKLDDMLIHSEEEYNSVDTIQEALKKLTNNSDPFVAPHSKASEIADKVIDTGNKVIDKGKKIIDNISEEIKDAAKFFFDKSPTFGDICNKISIKHEDFTKYPKIILNNLKDFLDESATTKINILKNILKDFASNTYINNKEVKSFLTRIKQQIEDLKPEAQKEETLTQKLQLDPKATRAEIAQAISKTYGGHEISKEIQLFIGDKSETIKTNYIPQKQLSDFGNDMNTLLQSSSEFQGKTDHASNLWKQEISLGKQTVSFIRSGTTRGNEFATKEILANALALKYSDDEILNHKEPLTLNFSNIQLMTPGKIADNKMPFEQMDAFQKLANSEIKLNYRGQEISVKIEKPLLFNFGVNAQTFNPPLSFRSFAENDKRNDESFKNLFGNFKIFGGENSNQKIDGHYSFGSDSIIGRALENISDKNTRDQILNLSDQILNIYSENKRGIGENPYALPSRVALLTNLLGYATSYGCKSGKDRTGIMAMELENLTAKVLTDNKPYDPYDQSAEEKQNLQSIYKAGCSIEIAKVNTGDVQNKLKIKDYGGLFTCNEKRFGINVAKSFDSNLEKLNHNS